MEATSDFSPIHISRQGASHIKAEKETKDIGRKFPCQDRSFSEVFAKTDDVPAFCFAAVSDGHGSAPHFRSGEGAEFAVNTMLECVKTHVKKISESREKSEINSELKVLTSEICAKWKSQVLEDIQRNPITETEYKYLAQEAGYEKYVEQYKNGVELENVYGCTALAVVSVPEKKLWFAFQIGDGDIVIKKKGGVDYVKPIRDDDSIGSETFSLCDKNAPELFKWNFALGDAEEISSAFCSSDGIFNSFNSDKGLFNFYNTIIEQFCYSDRGDEENTNIELRVKNLTNELANYLDDLSQKASHDDMSVSGFLEITSERILGHKSSEKFLSDGRWYLKQAENTSDSSEKIKNYDNSIGMFQKAAKNGFPEGYMWGGLAVLQKAKFEGKNEWANVQALFQGAINGGYLEAKKYLGKIQGQEAKDKLKEKKFSEALELFIKSVENDFAEAGFYLSKIYKNPQNYGDCTTANIQKSFNYLKKAATDGFAAAEFEIAKCYEKGDPIPANSETAAQYFEKALEQVRGNPALETEEFSKTIVLKTLAKFYAKSLPQKAVELCDEAIALGDKEAEHIKKDIQLDQPLTESAHGDLLKKDDNAVVDSEDKKQETPQFAPEPKNAPVQQKAPQSESTVAQNHAPQSHVSVQNPAQTAKVQQAPITQRQTVATHNPQDTRTQNNLQKNPYAEIDRAINELKDSFLNTMQAVRAIATPEANILFSKMVNLLNQLNTPQTDIRNKSAIVIDCRNLLSEADNLLSQKQPSSTVKTAYISDANLKK